MENASENSLDIIKTADGSYTLLNKKLEETYHSVNGAMTESKHVFITNGLLKHEGNTDDIHILEIGLGTGLNALLTLENIPEGKTIFYTAIEPFPVHKEIAEEYYSQFETKPKRLDVLDKIITAGGDAFLKIGENFFFRCSDLPLQKFSIEPLKSAYAGVNKNFRGFDIIYYDAFAPSKQPEMWELETIKTATDLLAANGILTSYCAQGQFKRHLKSLDLKIETLPGPPGKREMTLAKKTE